MRFVGNGYLDNLFLLGMVWLGGWMWCARMMMDGILTLERQGKKSRMKTKKHDQTICIDIHLLSKTP